MSWSISIYLLVFFFAKYRNKIPLMVRFNFSTIFTFCSFCVADSLMLLSARYVFIKALKNYVPLSVCIAFGRLIVSLKICSNTFLIAISCLDLTSCNHAYLDKKSITTITNLNPLLCFESLLITTKSVCHYSFIRCTTTGLVLKLRRIGLCKLYANWDFNHSSTSSADIFESCFFASWSSLDFPK